MPGNLLTADTSFPQLTNEQTTDEKFAIVTNYLRMLLEQLRYSMANLGMENFNRTELDSLAGFITQPVYLRLESTEGNVSTLYATAESLSSRMTSAEGGISSLVQTVEGFTLSVKNGAESSTIQLLSNGVELSSQLIHMDGLVTFTGLENGTTVVDGACIRTGSVIADVSIESPTIRGGRFYNTGGDAYLEIGGSGQGDLTLWGSGSNRVFRVYDNIGSASLSCYGVGFLTVGLNSAAAEGSWDFSRADVTGLYLRFS